MSRLRKRRKRGRRFPCVPEPALSGVEGCLLRFKLSPSTANTLRHSWITLTMKPLLTRIETITRKGKQFAEPAESVEPKDRIERQLS